MRAGFDPDSISERVLLDTTTEIFVAATRHGTFNLYRIVHNVKPSNRAAYCRTYLLAIIDRRCGVRDNISRWEPLSRPHSRKKARAVRRTMDHGPFCRGSAAARGSIRLFQPLLASRVEADLERSRADVSLVLIELSAGIGTLHLIQLVHATLLKIPGTAGSRGCGAP